MHNKRLLQLQQPFYYAQNQPFAGISKVFRLPIFLNDENTPESTGTKNAEPTDTTRHLISGTAVLKIFARKGTYIPTKSTAAEAVTANSRKVLLNSGTENRDFSSDLHSKTCIS